MKNRPCMAMISSKYSLLTSKEKIVADFIRKNPDSVVSMTTAELAEKAGVVPSVIVRCCRSLGYSGYRELKLALSADVARNDSFNYIPYIDSKDTSSDIFDKIFSANIKTLHDTAKGIDRKLIQSVTDLFFSAKNIYIYGIGTSSGIVNDFQYRLMQLGYSAFCFTDIVSMKVSALNIKSGDVAIGISNSGRTVATVDALSIAKDMGAKTICLTSYPDSCITKVSDYPIVICTDEIQYPIEAISARIAHISVLDVISVSLSAKNYENAIDRYEKTHKLIDTVRYKEKRR